MTSLSLNQLTWNVYLFRFSLIPLSNVLLIPGYIFHFFLNLFLIIYFNALKNGTVSLFSNYLLLICKNIVDVFILTLYSTILLKLFTSFSIFSYTFQYLFHIDKNAIHK